MNLSSRAVQKKGRHDVGHETPHEQDDVSNESRNVRLLHKPWHPLERMRHERYNQVVQASVLHTSETKSWTKELADTLHGFESRCLENDRHWDMLD